MSELPFDPETEEMIDDFLDSFPERSMTRLGVNIDHVATLRQARKALDPSPVDAALQAERAGAHGITVHLRQDRRHINESDVRLLREMVRTRLNIEMAVTPEMIDLALELKPDTVTFVPESPDELTTEGGLDVSSQIDPIERAIDRLREAGIETSLFIDPDPSQVEAASEAGAWMVELNTAAYSEAVPKGIRPWASEYSMELEKVGEAAMLADDESLRVLAGHGLTYHNVAPISAIPQIEELNIGHNLVARAVIVGIERAVREMLAAMNTHSVR